MKPTYSTVFRRYVRWARKKEKRTRWYAQASMLVHVVAEHILERCDVKAACAEAAK